MITHLIVRLIRKKYIKREFFFPETGRNNNEIKV